jgi:hypothetical protein
MNTWLIVIYEHVIFDELGLMKDAKLSKFEQVLEMIFFSKAK